MEGQFNPKQHMKQCSSLIRTSQIISQNPEQSSKLSSDRKQKSNNLVVDPNIDTNKARSRQTGNLIWFILITISTLSVPALNLILFLVEPGGLSSTVAKTLKTNNQQFWNEIGLNGEGRSADFFLFHLVIALYLFVTMVFITYSCYFTNLKERFKIFFMVDNIFVCMLASDISYAWTHTICFATTYQTTDKLIVTANRQFRAEDIIIIFLYCLSNFAMTGIFRVLMVCVDWNQWQILTYKMSIIISSACYILIGYFFISGSDQLSDQFNNFKQATYNLIDELLWGASKSEASLYIVPYLERVLAGLQQQKAEVDAFMLMYVFSNFAFTFQIVAKFGDFDGTATIKTSYKFNDSA